MYDLSEIYLSYCGTECPQRKECSFCDKDGLCLLDDPWFDCTDFQEAYQLDIASAEDEIDAIGANY